MTTSALDIAQEKVFNKNGDIEELKIKILISIKLKFTIFTVRPMISKSFSKIPKLSSAF